MRAQQCAIDRDEKGDFLLPLSLPLSVSDGDEVREGGREGPGQGRSPLSVCSLFPFLARSLVLGSLVRK